MEHRHARIAPAAREIREPETTQAGMRRPVWKVVGGTGFEPVTPTMSR